MRLKNLNPFFLILAIFSLIIFILPGRGKQPSDSTWLTDSERACTVIMVGKKASADGSTMATHTCDCGICDWTFRYVPATDHKPGEKRKIYHINQYKTWPPEQGLKWDLYKQDFTGLEIPEVPHTYAYIHGMFGYINENQVAIGESTIGTHRKLVNNTPSAKFDITMLTLIAMERARTAREAIKIMGSLAENMAMATTMTAKCFVFTIPMKFGFLKLCRSDRSGSLKAANLERFGVPSECPMIM